MSGFWESILGGGSSLFGYKELMDRFEGMRDDTMSGLEDLQAGLDDRTKFNPWTVTGPVGKVTGGPDGINFGLNDQQQQMMDMLQGGSQDFFQQAMQPTAEREQNIYERMRAAQRPEEQRRTEQMQGSLLNRGRSGIQSNMFGGTSEQFANSKAIAEAQNQAMLGAMNQAQAEQMQQYNLGAGMMGQSYMPMQQLQGLAGMGLNNAQMLQQAQMNNANLYAQLGLGGITADTNYGNMLGNAFGNMVTAGSGLLGGIGGRMDQAGGIGGVWDMIKGLF